MISLTLVISEFLSLSNPLPLGLSPRVTGDSPVCIIGERLCHVVVRKKGQNVYTAVCVGLKSMVPRKRKF